MAATRTPRFADHVTKRNGGSGDDNGLLPAIRRHKHKSKQAHTRNYNFECDWLIELSDNNLASELVENSSFLIQSQSRKL